MNRRISTDAKLATIIHSKNDDQEIEDALRRQEKQAKLRLRRACLYGGGARTKVPNVKKTKKASWSPFHLDGGITDEPPPIAINNSGPPGAHEEMFRMVTNSTKQSYNDPDRICFNSTRMKDGLRVMSQPPWYIGYQNQTIPSDKSFLTAATRYGYRGSKNIMEHHTQPYAQPAQTRTEHTPSFLQADSDYIDEYVPPILLTKAGTINNMEAPRLWPENAEFVTGYGNKKLPTLWKYKRETTVDLSVDARPKSPSALATFTQRQLDERGIVNDYAKMESLRTTQSAPQLAQLKFETSWRDTMMTNGTATLKKTLKGDLKPPYIPQTLLDPTDSMRYSGTSAMIIHSQSTDELKLRLRMEKAKEKVNAPYYSRWTHVTQHLDNISRKLKRHQHFNHALLKIAELFQQVARHGGSETAMRRAEFVSACGRMTFFEDVSAKQMSQLFSLFDPMRRDAMRFVEFVQMLAVLDQPDQTGMEKLQRIWDLSLTFGLDRGLFDLALDALSLCAGSLSDAAEVEGLFKEEFRPRCYELAVLGRSAAVDDFPVRFNTTIGNGSSSGQIRPNTTTATSVQDEKLGVSTDDNIIPVAARTGRESTAPSPTNKAVRPISGAAAGGDLNTADVTNSSGRRGQAIAPPYSICESFLSQPRSFVATLRHCPKLCALFDLQLSARLVQAFGRDERKLKEEQAELLMQRGDAQKKMDFTWIMQREAPKREVFSIFSETG